MTKYYISKRSASSLAAHQLNNIKTLRVKTCSLLPQTKVLQASWCSAGKIIHLKTGSEVQTAGKHKPQLVVVVDWSFRWSKGWMDKTWKTTVDGCRKSPRTRKYFGLKLERGKKQTETKIFDSTSLEVTQILKFTCVYHSYLNMELSIENLTW